MSRVFGLIGYPLSHSFSKRFFTEKFLREGIEDCAYELFPLVQIEMLPGLLSQNPDLHGLNVTIPYKEAILPYLDTIDPGAAAVGAVNTIRIERNRLTGYNTDVFGFQESLDRFLKIHRLTPSGALVLGTGGAAKAVAWALHQMKIPFLFVSRSDGANRIQYERLGIKHLGQYPLIINTSPLGMAPLTDQCPPIPYEHLTSDNLLFDLVYNPEQTLFLERGAQMGCAIANGLEMLYLQAEKAWEIWNA